MKKATRSNLWLAVTSVAAVLVLATSGTFAWLSKEQKAEEIYMALSDFEIDGILSFGNTVYENNDVMVPVSFREGDPNYIGNMKYVVRYQGASPAYLRVRVLEQWVDASTNEILSASYLNYAVSDVVGAVDPVNGAVTYPAAGPGGKSAVLTETGVWVDNRSNDYCYYYSVPVQPKSIVMQTTGSNVSGIGDGLVELTLIDQTVADTAGMIAGIDPSTTKLMLLFEVEAVQPNRYREFFDIDKIPSPPPTEP